MWRIGSQTPPSRMMIPWAAAADAAGAAAGVAEPVTGVAAPAGDPKNAATTTAAGNASAILRRRL